MKTRWIVSLSVLSLALASNSAHAFWFFFLPGGAVSAIGDAITGSEGSNCVGSNANVGDRIRLPDGSVGAIKSLSGSSSRCTNPAHPIRALVVPANDSTPNSSSNPNSSATYTPSRLVPANPIVGIDLPNESIVSGSIAFSSNAGIALPEGWESKEVPANVREKGYFFYAAHNAIEAGLVMNATKRQSVTDVMEYVRSGRRSQKSSLVNARETGIEELQVNGMPAWRFEVTGMDWKGRNFTYLVTYVDVGLEVLVIRAFSPTAGYGEQRTALSNLAYGIKAVPAPVVATQPAAAPVPIPVVTIPEKTSESHGSIATRLGVLNRLYKDRLINETDFESKKQEILRGL